MSNFDLMLCHSKNHYVVPGTDPNKSIFVDMNKSVNPDFVINLFQTQFLCKKPIFQRVFMMFCIGNEQLLETEHFVRSVANVLKSGGFFLIPSIIFEWHPEWTLDVFNKKIKPYFYTKPVGKYEFKDKRNVLQKLTMFERR